MNNIYLYFSSSMLKIPVNDTLACVSCNKPLQELLFNEQFFPLLFKIIMPFPLIGILFLAINYKRFIAESSIIKRAKTLIFAGFFLGVGMTGFLDGIFLHQILQWHQMISNILPPDTLINKQVNTFWDGIFHVFTWTMTAIGVLLLWKLNRKKNKLNFSNKVFAGSIILGGGIFNFLDSIINHYILQLHNIREKTEYPMIYNHVFLVFAILLIIIGLMLIRNGLKRSPV